MIQIFKGAILVLFALFISACSTVKQASQRPSWIDNPGKGVSVSAGMHVGGRVAQEELAILRGRTEFAKRLGVNIQSEQTSATSVINDRSSTVGAQLTHEDTNQNDIKVLVKEKWREPETDVLWVLLVPADK
jgi:hypothetical protein